MKKLLLSLTALFTLSLPVFAIEPSLVLDGENLIVSLITDDCNTHSNWIKVQKSCSNNSYTRECQVKSNVELLIVPKSRRACHNQKVSTFIFDLASNGVYLENFSVKLNGQDVEVQNN